MLTRSGMTWTGTFNGYCSLTASSLMTPVIFSSCMGEMHVVLRKLLSVNLYRCVDIDDYRSQVTLGLTEAWKTAQTNIALAQKRQKVQHTYIHKYLPVAVFV